MKYTSAEASKLLRKLNDDIKAELQLESQSREFVAATTEVPDDVRPEYDYAAANAKIDALQASVRRLKHAINVFNAATVVPGFDFTIDDADLRALGAFADTLKNVPTIEVEPYDAYGIDKAHKLG